MIEWNATCVLSVFLKAKEVEAPGFCSKPLFFSVAAVNRA